MLVQWKIEAGLGEDIWPMSESMVELNHLITITIHIVLALVIAIFIVVLKPELIDGGMPEMRKKIFSKLPQTFITKKLSR